MSTFSEKYQSLPMLLGPEEIAQAVADILADATTDPRIPREEIAGALSGMIDRASSNPWPRDEAVARQIENWAASVWAEDDPQFFDILTFLIVNTNHGKARALLERALTSADPQIRAIAKDALEEL